MDKKSSALTAIIGGVFIFALKLYTWYISDSIALLSDALESIVNIIASMMMYWSIRVSEKPPDKSHPYGQSACAFRRIADSAGRIRSFEQPR